MLVSALGFRVQALRFRVWSFFVLSVPVSTCRVLGFRVQGLQGREPQMLVLKGLCIERISSAFRPKLLNF